MFAIELFWAHFFEDFGSQLLHLVDEFRSQLTVCHALQVLKLALLLDRANQGRAVTVGEHLLDQASNPVLVIDGI